jgi:hypothetical protein
MYGYNYTVILIKATDRDRLYLNLNYVGLGITLQSDFT